VHLSEEAAWPVADALAARGIPFVFTLSTVLNMPPAHVAKPCLLKPIDLAELVEVLGGLCATRQAAGGSGIAEGDDDLFGDAEGFFGSLNGSVDLRKRRAHRASDMTLTNSTHGGTSCTSCTSCTASAQALPCSRCSTASGIKRPDGEPDRGRGDRPRP
jgi:hypothetical protein